MFIEYIGYKDLKDKKKNFVWFSLYYCNW